MFELSTNNKNEDENLQIPNEHVERLILKKFLTDPLYSTFIVENYQPEFFENPIVRYALRVGALYYNKFKEPPKAELLARLVAGDEHPEEALQVETTANFNLPMAETFAQEVIKGFYQQKGFFYLVYMNSEKIMRDRDVMPYIKELNRIGSLDMNFDMGFNYFENIEEHIFDLVTPERRLSTGYSQLDKLCNGGFPEMGKCLIVLLAQAGLGKSMTMHNIASRMIPMGKKVLIVSLEMTEQIYSRRISANMTKRCIDYLSEDENIVVIKDNVENINSIEGAGLVIKEFPPSTLRAMGLANYIARLILTGFKPDIIFVDYLNLMVPNSMVKGGGSYERVGDIAKELRALSYMFEVPFVSASQVNRDGFNSSDIDMSNISESAQTAHHADAIFALHADMETAPNDYFMKVLKNRFGGRINSRLQYNMNYDNLILSEINFNGAPKPALVPATNSLVEDITKELEI